MKRLVSIGLFALVWSSVVLPEREAVAAQCSSQTNTSSGVGGLLTDGSSSCETGSNASSGAGAVEPLVKTVDCGPVQVADDHSVSFTGDFCVFIDNVCAVSSAADVPINTTTQATLTQAPDGTWHLSSFDCRVTVAPSAPDTAAYAQALRLVPHPDIGMGPPGGITLVNIQTLFWLTTTPDRDLGTVTLLGHHIHLAVHVNHVNWTYGDGTTATLTTPGRPYTRTDPCDTPLCPDYDGHIYTTTGPMTITATTTWTARYQTDNGPWHTLTHTITGPPQTTHLTVKQTAAILVPGPYDH